MLVLARSDAAARELKSALANYMEIGTDDLATFGIDVVERIRTLAGEELRCMRRSWILRNHNHRLLFREQSGKKRACR